MMNLSTNDGHSNARALLSALLSRDNAQRQAAEKHMQSLPVEQRCVTWLNILQSPGQEQHYYHMAAVLLRRDILKTTQGNLLISMVDPLLMLALPSEISPNTISMPDIIVMAIGHCLAELCAVLQVVDPTQSVCVMQRIFTLITPQVRIGNVITCVVYCVNTHHGSHRCYTTL
jgi:hypothetical protein